MQRLVDVAGRRVLAVENRKVLDLVCFRAILAAEARHRLAEIHDAVIRSGPRSNQIDDRQLRIFFEQHRDGTGALGWLTRAAASVLGDIGTNDNGLATGAVEGKMTNRALHAVHAAEAGVFEFGNFAAAANRRLAAGDQRFVDHAFDDDRTG